MSFDRRAVIDIGTNSIKLLVGEVSGKTVEPLLETSEQTRLGKGFYETHRLQPDSIERTVRAVAQFAAKAGELNAASIRLIATSAVRDAENSSELTGPIEQATGLRVEVISGEQEAEWASLGVTSNPQFAGHALLILDVGGGSTEFILAKNSTLYFRNSFRMGTVRLLEKLKPSDPPTDAELAACREWLAGFLRQQISPELLPNLSSGHRNDLQLVGTGGSATILAMMHLEMSAFDRERIESARIRLGDIQRLVNRLWKMPLEERKTIPGLPPNRADVILAGAAIYEAIMEQFEFDVLRVSTRGMRFAALMDSRG